MRLLRAAEVNHKCDARDVAYGTAFLCVCLAIIVVGDHLQAWPAAAAFWSQMMSAAQQ
jgi:hypothetical protein